jgi:taurine dioxygenase
MTGQSISWRPLPGPFGAEVTGCDVRALDAAELLRLSADRQLLVIRGQGLTPGDLQAFAATLGTLDTYPYAEPLPGFPHVVPIIKNPDDMANFGGDWHSDTSYLECPPGLTLLYAVELPATGGDTLFADMCGAYASLSPVFRRWLDTLVCHNVSGMVHDADGAHAAVVGQGTGLRAAPPRAADHPVVRVHPLTGRPALYVSRIHTEHFVGMTRAESLPIIDYLQALATAPERCVRLRWEPGTLAIWDNRSLQHNPLNDYHGQRREMHRVILKGERPFGRDALRPATTPQGQ